MKAEAGEYASRHHIWLTRMCKTTISRAGHLEAYAVRLEKILSVWTPETLAQRIAEGEELLVEFRREPQWMSEVVQVELGKKRELLDALRREAVPAH